MGAIELWFAGVGVWFPVSRRHADSWGVSWGACRMCGVGPTDVALCQASLL